MLLLSFRSLLKLNILYYVEADSRWAPLNFWFCINRRSTHFNTQEEHLYLSKLAPSATAITFRKLSMKVNIWKEVLQRAIITIISEKHHNWRQACCKVVTRYLEMHYYLCRHLHWRFLWAVFLAVLTATSDQLLNWGKYEKDHSCCNPQDLRSRSAIKPINSGPSLSQSMHYTLHTVQELQCNRSKL